MSVKTHPRDAELRMRKRKWLMGAGSAILLLMGACEGSIDSGDPGPRVDGPAPNVPGTLPPRSTDPIAPGDIEPGRSVRRMTADQFVNSLEVATGQRWSDFDRFAGALGRADLQQVTEEGRAPNVTFDKLVGDAARATCADAIEADLEAEDRTSRRIVHEVEFSERAPEALATNIQYLLLRFLGLPEVPVEDERVQTWLPLVTEGTAEFTDAEMAERWEAVCIGLATHPDFVTY